MMCPSRKKSIKITDRLFWDRNGFNYWWRGFIQNEPFFRGNVEFPKSATNYF